MINDADAEAAGKGMAQAIEDAFWSYISCLKSEIEEMDIIASREE